MLAVARAALFLLLAACVPAGAAQRTVYLTFDDGPLNGTANVLDVLEAQQVPAALFMVGQHALVSPERGALVTRAKSLPLVTVGNHSFSHANNRYQRFYADTEAVVADMLKANTVLGLKAPPPVPARLPGRDVFRLQYMSRDDFGLSLEEAQREQVDFEFVAASGFHLYGWDFEWVHEDSGKPVQSVDRLIDEIGHLFAAGRTVGKNKLVLLMHDEMFQDVFQGRDKLTALVTGLRAKGYAFGHIADYDTATSP
ncbi:MULTISPECIES: polysaccharide deacetylase family protein [Phyllobacteriaceae]|jgi:peptidoglycan/xylan/chitin deacetylase (PgdA/CDA1 family)|uniref:Chitooligosaccharide deacetylase n=1 Tax=Mesorhizobium hungaricum TaxID=1566387 RepID=A0A1C2DNC0_9HYPH|nr:MULTISPECIES: polysaccharide deacetylase family protein [Mesorhizobium]MBN9233840.1 polysaccharide deacetylase family protein [Mesorhizobium sp.]MDQ0328351.1 peptidoglycan/xylan/chitin deacetylase (PgdA/CDA1 family) [Mesorhizobium sp. YL-MeA3-2017]OCX16267.1 polysaccharide deacetylase [Mesorhizobium hungaricum]